MKKNYNTPHGLMECYENYLVFYLSSSGISGNAAKEILAFASDHYEKRPYVFISNRALPSDIDPAAYKAINSKIMVGLAIVSESEAVRNEAMVEMDMYDGSFSYFKTVDEAVEWAKTVIKEI